MHSIKLVEQVQRRFTKRLHGYHDIAYAEWLRLLNLEMLEARRIEFNLVFCYKIIFDLVSVNNNDFLNRQLLGLEVTHSNIINILVIVKQGRHFSAKEW